MGECKDTKGVMIDLAQVFTYCDRIANKVLLGIILTNLNNAIIFFKYQLIVFGESGLNGQNAAHHAVVATRPGPEIRMLRQKMVKNHFSVK